MSSLTLIARYKAWADELLFAAAAALPPDNLWRPQPIVFGSLLRTLHHVYAMDTVWRSHLQGKPHGFKTRNPEKCPAFDKLRSMQREIDEWYVEYVADLPEEQLVEPVQFTFIGGEAGVMSRGNILTHVVNHTTYHRGHIADMLYHLEVHPPTTDFPVFLRDMRNAGASTSICASSSAS